jgi:hypothetical protein
MEKMLNSMEEPKSLTDAWTLEDETFSADTLLSTIMTKGMTFEPLFTDPRFFYMMNEQWWNKWKFVFGKWFYATNFEYEPLWDRNGYETVHEDTADTGTSDTSTTDREVIDRDTTGSKTSQEVMDDDTTGSKSSREVVDEDTTSHTVTSDDTQESGKDTVNHNSDKDIDTTREVSAFDSSTYQPHDTEHTDETLNSEKTETTYGKKTEEDIVTDTTGTLDSTTTGTESTTGTDDRTTDYTENTTGTEDVTTNKTGSVDTDTTNDRDFDRDYHSWGNWGISQTSQKLLKSEYEVRYWNLYEHMADIFIDEMTIGVY